MIRAGAAGCKGAPSDNDEGLQPTMTLFPTPFESFPGAVVAEWIDSNDHMNLAYYIVLFDRATDALFLPFGIGPDYKARTGCGTFAAETHNIYDQELLLGERVRVNTLVLGVDDKRMHIAHEMFRLSDGVRAASQELLYLHVDLGRRKVVQWPDDARRIVETAFAAHATVPRPDWVGRSVGMRRR
jgi:acyl-CoA thioester hydrolase